MTTETIEQELHRLLHEEAEYLRYNRFYEMYPDSGPLSREHYPRHMECFAAGREYQSRCFMGGNGCIGPWTRVETPDGAVPVAELLGREEFVVRSWVDGSQCDAQAGGVFLKELAPAFRVYLDNGQWFDCNHTHRVLTSEGMLWFAHLVHGAGGLRYTRTAQDCLANYVAGGRRGGAPLLLATGSDLAPPPSRDDVRARLLSAVALGDAAEHTPVRTHAYRGTVRFPSRVYDPARVAALCAQFADPTPQLDLRWSEETRQAAQLLALACAQDQAAPAPALAPALCSASGEDGEPSARDASSTSARLAGWCQERGLSAQQIRPGQWLEPAIDGDLGEWVFCPSEHVPLVGGNKIVAIVPLGIQPILDLTVEGTHTYLSAGVVHHNTGKTYGVTAYELTCHLTGEYPHWWVGRRFNGPIEAWVAGDTRETVRDIIQAKIIGDVAKKGDAALGTGMIPRNRIKELVYVKNTNRCADFATIEHVSGGNSVLGFKSYDQGREAFQGTEKHIICLDEEPPEDIFDECTQRGRVVDGITLLTFTPLSGGTAVVNGFLDWKAANAKGARKILITCSWDDVPHLTEEWKKATLAATPLYMRDARIRGIPTAGRGRIYPVEEEEFVIKPVQIPSHWRRCFGFDGGWHNTAAVWMAWDKDEDVVYVYSEYKRGEQPIDVHAVAILARGRWIPGAGDAAAREGHSNDTVLDLYKARGVNLVLANKAVDLGIQTVMSRLSTGKLKVFNTCQKWLNEYRTYSYDEKQNIIKHNDHLMDATRFGVMSGLSRATTERQPQIYIPNISFS